MKLLVTILQLLIILESFGQNINTDSLVNDFKAYGASHLQEKLFLHSDKSFYMAGDVVWFKIYATDGVLQRPLELSKVAYVELVSDDKKAMLQAKIALTDASGSGSFMIPFSLASGNYSIRAYTNWMKNYSADYYFEKPVSIVNTLKKPVGNEKDTSNVEVHFFPEGGNLVEGLETVIGFKVNNEAGKGIDCSGYIINQKNETICHFSSLKFGMGRFQLTPKKGDSYHAIINSKEGITRQALPAMQTSGYTMLVKPFDGNQISIIVSTNEAAAGSPLYLFIHTRQSPKAVLTNKLTHGKTEFLINKSILGEGISHITIFNGERKPVCERLYFTQPRQRLQVNLQTDTTVYSRRQPVKVTLAISDKQQPVTIANMSMAVVLKDSIQPYDEQHILSYLWLSSDLRGNIESPDFYFNDSSDQVLTAADNLMLSQGWRRFLWKDISSNKKTTMEYLPEYDGQIISGTITQKTTGLPVPGITTFLTLAGKSFQTANATSNANGQLSFNLKNSIGRNEIIVQTNNTTDSSYNINISNQYSDKFSETQNHALILKPGWSNELIGRSISTQVQHVYAPELWQHYNLDDADTAIFYGSQGKKYNLDDYTRFTTMEEVLREYVKEVRLRKAQDHYFLNVRTNTAETGFEGEPLVLLDGTPIFEIDKLVAFDPLKIKTIDVVPQKYFLGTMVSDGIVSFSTYDGDLAGFPPSASWLILQFPGLQLEREFFTPTYESPEKIASRLPDFRNTLYWNPGIKAGTRAQQLSFFTSDLPGKYIVTVQGITASGLANYGTLTFEVK